MLKNNVDTFSASELLMPTFLNRLEICKNNFGKELPLFIRIRDKDMGLDYAQTGWRFQILYNEVPALVNPVVGEIPSNYENVHTVNELVNDIHALWYTWERPMTSDDRPIFIKLGEEVESLGCMLPGVKIGLGIVDLDLLGVPTYKESEISFKRQEYCIIESTFCRTPWTFGEIYHPITLSITSL